MGNEQSTSKELGKNETVPEKHENISVNGIATDRTSSGLELEVQSEPIIQPNGKPFSLTTATETSLPDSIGVKSNCQPIETIVGYDFPEMTIVTDEVKKDKGRAFGKIFKKKAADVKRVQEDEAETDRSPPTTDPQLEAADPQQDPEPLTELQSVTPGPSPAEEQAPESDSGGSRPEDHPEPSSPEENPVMNFFKTLVAPTKTLKKEAATPDAAKDQSQKESQPSAATTVAQVSEPPAVPKGMSIPPPPPPEPPKLEIKGEPAAKAVKPVTREEPKTAAKEPESSKAKSAKDSLSKFFRPKPVRGEPQPAVEVQVEVQNENKVEPQETAKEVAQSVVKKQVVDGLQQPVVEAEKADPSKASTLEAAAKPEPPPPVQEEKKAASKSSFSALFKPKAADAKRAATATAAAADTAPPVKAKEEPKTTAKASEACVDVKPASVVPKAGDAGAAVPKKLEKRNSIQLFFKNLGQKRHSTDAGVQTEPVTVAPAADKAK